jgi:hypothetical protein
MKEDPDCRKIDREHAIASKVSKALDLTITTDISDYDEAVSIYFDWDPVWTADECIARANETIEHMNFLIAAFRSAKKLKAVKL